MHHILTVISQTAARARIYISRYPLFILNYTLSTREAFIIVVVLCITRKMLSCKKKESFKKKMCLWHIQTTYFPHCIYFSKLHKALPSRSLNLTASNSSEHSPLIVCTVLLSRALPLPSCYTSSSFLLYTIYTFFSLLLLSFAPFFFLF